MTNVESISQGRDVHPLFYEIKDQEGSNRGYMFGTIHASDEACRNLNQTIWNCFAKSQSLMVEIDSTKKWIKFKTTMLALTSIDIMAMSVKIAMALESADIDIKAIDSILLQRARKEKKTIHALEPFSVQRAVIRLASKKFKKIKFDELDKISNRLQTTVSAWKVGDTEKLKVTCDQKKDDPDVEACSGCKLTFQRNENMAKRIHDYLNNNCETIFVAIGVAHLVDGDDENQKGMVSHLKSLGWTVEQIGKSNKGRRKSKHSIKKAAH